MVMQSEPRQVAKIGKVAANLRWPLCYCNLNFFQLINVIIENHEDISPQKFSLYVLSITLYTHCYRHALNFAV